jgi:hypothetical protein
LASEIFYPLIVNTNIATLASYASSPTVYVAKEIDPKHTLDIMLTNGIRNVVVRDGTITYLINDRKILEFLFSPKGREIISMGKTEIGTIKVDDLDLIPISKMDDDITITKAAKLLMDIRQQDAMCII